MSYNNNFGCCAAHDFPMSNLSSIALGLTPSDTVDFLNVLARCTRESETFNQPFGLRQYDSCIVLEFNNVEWSLDNRDAMFLMQYLELLHSIGHPAAYLQISGDNYHEWACNGGETIIHQCCELDKKNCCITFNPSISKPNK